MRIWIIGLTVCLCLLQNTLGTNQVIVRENVVFQKLDRKVSSRSVWNIAFSLELEPQRELLETISDRLDAVKTRIYKIWEENKNSPSGYAVERINEIITKIRVEIESSGKLQEYLKTEFAEIQLLRRKRSLLPIIGKAMSWLFGTISEDDLAGIQGHIRNLYRGQKTITHVMSKTLTVVKVLENRTITNSGKINELIDSLGDLSDRLRNITKEVEEIQRHMRIYVELDRLMSEISSAIEVAREYNSQLEMLLNMVSLGHVSPAVVAPTNLKVVLVEIARELANSRSKFELPYNLDSELWLYYKTLACVAIVEESRLIVITAIPMFDRTNKFEIYRVINLAVPRFGMLAKFELETDVLVINDRRNWFSVLTPHEIEECLGQSHLCLLDGPLLSVSNSGTCLVQLFMNNQKGIKNSCRSLVLLNSQFPRAEFIGDGNWVISTDTPLTFTILCESQTETYQPTKTIKGPIDVITLNKTCSAHNYKMSLPMHHTQKSTTDWTDPIVELVTNVKFSNLSCWKEWEKVGKHLSNIKIPKKLKSVKEIPIQNLVDELNSINLDSTEVEFSRSTVWLIVSTILGILALVSVVGFCCKARCRKLIPTSFRERVSRNAQSGGDGEGDLPGWEGDHGEPDVRKYEQDRHGSMAIGLVRNDQGREMRTGATTASAPDAEHRVNVGSFRVGQPQTTGSGPLHESLEPGNVLPTLSSKTSSMAKMEQRGVPHDGVRLLYPNIRKELGYE